MYTIFLTYAFPCFINVFLSLLQRADPLPFESFPRVKSLSNLRTMVRIGQSATESEPCSSLELLSHTECVSGAELYSSTIDSDAPNTSDEFAAHSKIGGEAHAMNSL
jgi:hypothetical protein